MIPLRFLGAGFLLLSSAALPAAAQNTIAQRVERAPDGVVHLQFAGRAGVCGDGRDMVGYRKALFASNFQSFGSSTASRCAPGPVRASLSVSGGRVTHMQTFVGGSWARTNARVTDLGTVSSAEAASYFFALIPQIEGRVKKERFLLPAVLADDAATVHRLIALARDGARASDTRRQAIQWIGLLGDSSAVSTLVSFARQGGDAPRGEHINDDDDAPGKKGLATAAIAALSFLETGVGIPALIDLARTGGSAVRHSAVFWLGQSGDPRAFNALHAVIENSAEEERIRAHAIFSLSQGADRAEPEFAYLRGLYPRLRSEKLKESVLQGMGQDEERGSAWLLQRGRDRGESRKIRKAALFWAGQNESTPTRDLVAFYRDVEERELREHAIFVLSQRDDAAALDELVRIAKSDADREMRGKALFWLSQKDDARAANLISERLSR